MKILITGNMGYVGPGVVSHLRQKFPDSILAGFDMAYFAACLTNTSVVPESKLDVQFFGDVRTIHADVFEGIDVVIHLAAISNDPMGMRFEEVTMDVNYRSSIKIARMAKEAGAKVFIFASSCSMYGAAEGRPKTENSLLNPLTAYARSKVYTEQDLALMADERFKVTCLRFATACGMSDRLRLDLVLNDFVAGAVASGKIDILSDGSPWRPLIHVKDMARAIEWAIIRTADAESAFIALNVGSKAWNYQVWELAEAVASAIPGTRVKLNNHAPPDKRSYRVNFNLFKSLAPYHQPVYTLKQTIAELYASLFSMNFKNHDFRNSDFMRLKVLTSLQEKHYINSKLEWTPKTLDVAEFEHTLKTS